MFKALEVIAIALAGIADRLETLAENVAFLGTVWQCSWCMGSGRAPERVYGDEEVRPLQGRCPACNGKGH